MSTKAKIAYGIVLAISATSGGSYTAIAEITDITPPAKSIDKVKVQRSDNSTAVVEKIPGWLELSEAELTCTYVTASKTAFEAAIGVLQYFKITLPLTGAQSVAGDTYAWYGFLSDIADETPLKDFMKSKVKVAVSGTVTFAAGS